MSGRLTPEVRAEVAAVRARCRAQATVWQRIPAMALAAATPLDDVLELTYGAGYFPLGASNHMYTAYVDCVTGEIVRADNPDRPASDAVVATLLDQPHYLDVGAVARNLHRIVVGRGSDDPHAAWRADLKACLGLDARRPYVREQPGIG